MGRCESHVDRKLSVCSLKQLYEREKPPYGSLTASDSKPHLKVSVEAPTLLSVTFAKLWMAVKNAHCLSQLCST